MNEILEFVGREPIVDVHEHHVPATLRDPDVGLLRLLQESYAGWTRQRPYPLEGEKPPVPDAERWRHTTWDDLRPYVEDSGSNMFVRNLVRALGELYGLSGEGITARNWKALDDSIRSHHADAGWVRSVLDRARLRAVITDPYVDPLLDARRELGDLYCSVLRINGFAYGWHPDAADHNGNNGQTFARRLGCEVESFDDYMDFLQIAVDTLGHRHQVGLKNALAYDRTLNFDDVDIGLARRAWGRREPLPDEQKAFGDVVVDRLAKLAGDREVPFQMHLGSARIRGSHPMNAAGLIERHPRTRFVLMHLAYPWTGDLLGMAFVYRNIWLDLSWGPLLSPTHFRNAVHEAIEVLPDESRLMIGGDNWHVEESYGTLMCVRRLLGEVLTEKVDAGYFTTRDALRLAWKILSENATLVFRLPR